MNPTSSRRTAETKPPIASTSRITVPLPSSSRRGSHPHHLTNAELFAQEEREERARSGSSAPATRLAEPEYLVSLDRFERGHAQDRRSFFEDRRQAAIQRALRDAPWPLPFGWELDVDRDCVVYYRCRDLMKKQWEFPTPAQAQPEFESSGFSKIFTAEGKDSISQKRKRSSAAIYAVVKKKKTFHRKASELLGVTVYCESSTSAGEEDLDLDPDLEFGFEEMNLKAEHKPKQEFYRERDGRILFPALVPIPEDASAEAKTQLQKIKLRRRFIRDLEQNKINCFALFRDEDSFRSSRTIEEIAVDRYIPDGHIAPSTYYLRCLVRQSKGNSLSQAEIDVLARGDTTARRSADTAGERRPILQRPSFIPIAKSEGESSAEDAPPKKAAKKHLSKRERKRTYDFPSDSD